MVLAMGLDVKGSWTMGGLHRELVPWGWGLQWWSWTMGLRDWVVLDCRVGGCGAGPPWGRATVGQGHCGAGPPSPAPQASELGMTSAFYKYILTTMVRHDPHDAPHDLLMISC